MPGVIQHSTIEEMEKWRKQCFDLAKTDRIGHVMWEAVKLLGGLTANPVSVSDLEYAADMVSNTRTTTMKHDGSHASLNLEELNRAYDEMRKCCYGMTEAVEMTIRVLISSNRIEHVQEVKSTESTEFDEVEVKREENEINGERTIEAASKNSPEEPGAGECGMMEENDAENSKVCINPNDYCLLQKEECDGEEGQEENVDDMSASLDDSIDIRSSADSTSSIDGSSCALAPIQGTSSRRESNTTKRISNVTTEVCNKMNRGTNTKAHERTHTRDRPFKCDHCGSRFLTNSKFKEHERTHTGERPFKCEECGLTFARANTLKAHKLVHTEDRPYKCEICTAVFKERRTLEKHHSRVHAKATIDR